MSISYGRMYIVFFVQNLPSCILNTHVCINSFLALSSSVKPHIHVYMYMHTYLQEKEGMSGTH